ncbi:putative Trihydrophobin [Seiridium unicorne]|uniref:Trihydrophobin n=1 Tax=Seiridium unicorne TaxID=138068 RepID=A0ABR2UZC2_9PEZI
MQFFTLAALLTAAMAAPSLMERQTYTACSGLYSTAQCCSTDVATLADIDCQNPSETLTNATQFQSVCAAVGQTARCCVIPVGGIVDLLCETPTGVTE